MTSVLTGLTNFNVQPETQPQYDGIVGYLSEKEQQDPQGFRTTVERVTPELIGLFYGADAVREMEKGNSPI